MTPQEYIQKAKRTEPESYRFKGINGTTPAIEHAVMGLVTEAGELMDAIKKTKIYGKELDKVNVKEELGDIFWYLAIICGDLDTTFEKLWEQNIKKLEIRYPEKYTDEKASNRDLKSERSTLEKHS